MLLRTQHRFYRFFTTINPQTAKHFLTKQSLAAKHFSSEYLTKYNIYATTSNANSHCFQRENNGITVYQW